MMGRESCTFACLNKRKLLLSVATLNWPENQQRYKQRGKKPKRFNRRKIFCAVFGNNFFTLPQIVNYLSLFFMFTSIGECMKSCDFLFSLFFLRRERILGCMTKRENFFFVFFLFQFYFCFSLHYFFFWCFDF